MYGIQHGIKFTLTGADGTVGVFNDTADANHVGVLSSEDGVTGLESTEIRENNDDLTEADGGVHGAFYRGRRPVTFKGQVTPISSTTDRNTKLQKLIRASTGLRQMYPADTSGGNVTVAFTPDGGVPVYFTARTQVPARTPGTWIKDFFIGLVAADVRIYSTTLVDTGDLTFTPSATVAGRSYDRSYDINYDWGTQVRQANITNNGDGIAPVKINIDGPGQNPAVQNVSTGEELALTYTLQANERLVLDTLARTITLETYAVTAGTGAVLSSANRYGALVVPRSLWWGLKPGVNDIRWLFYSGGTGKGRLTHRHTWI